MPPQRPVFLTSMLSRDNLSNPHDLDLWVNPMKPSNDTSWWKTILQINRDPPKIVPVMVQTKIWSSSVTLTLLERMLQIAHLHVIENNCAKLFCNPSTTAQVMVRKNSDRHMHAHTPNCHCDNCVLLTESGLYKNVILIFDLDRGP